MNQYVMVLNGSWLGGYINGELKGYRNGVPYTVGNDRGLYIGKSVYGMFNVWGYVYQVLVYSRVLSGSEIRRMYQNPEDPPREGLVLWLKADPQYVRDGDGMPDLRVDLSGRGNHGRITALGWCGVAYCSLVGMT